MYVYYCYTDIFKLMMFVYEGYSEFTELIDVGRLEALRKAAIGSLFGL